jgi:hypothetical protein
MGKIVELIENQLVGESGTTKLYPITHTDGVYDSNNKSLTTILKELNTSITDGNHEIWTAFGAYIQKGSNIINDTFSISQDTDYGTGVNRIVLNKNGNFEVHTDRSLNLDSEDTTNLQGGNVNINSLSGDVVIESSGGVTIKNNTGVVPALNVTGASLLSGTALVTRTLTAGTFKTNLIENSASNSPIEIKSKNNSDDDYSSITIKTGITEDNIKIYGYNGPVVIEGSDLSDGEINEYSGVRITSGTVYINTTDGVHIKGSLHVTGSITSDMPESVQLNKLASVNSASSLTFIDLGTIDNITGNFIPITEPSVAMEILDNYNKGEIDCRLKCLIKGNQCIFPLSGYVDNTLYFNYKTSLIEIKLEENSWGEQLTHNLIKE